MREFYAEMRATNDIALLWEAFVGYFRSRGVEHLCVIHIPPPGAPDAGTRTIRTEGYPSEWTHRYIDEGLYRYDPIPSHARTHPAPFRWSDIAQLRKLSAKEKAFLKEFEALGIGDGIAIPVFGPHGRHGYVGLSAGPDGGKFAEEDWREFQIVAQMAHQRYCEILAADDCEDISLSERESEVLEWVARGKSNSAIAGILDISANTVDTHLRRIYDKLGVSDRTTAAIRGIGCGLINP